MPTHSAGLSTGQGLLLMTELAGGNVQEESAAEVGGDPLMEEEAVNWTQAASKEQRAKSKELSSGIS